MDHGMSDDKGEDLRNRALSGVRRLRHLELDILEAEILDGLMDGRKNAVELVAHVYGLQRGRQGFRASYLRVCRALRGLESRGLVSTRLFGRDKPYRLTQHGVAVLASIVPEMDQPRILARGDLLLLLITGIVGVALFLYSRGLLTAPEWGPALLLFAVFFILVGISMTLIARVIRRVF
jgi:hypothetical protein